MWHDVVGGVLVHEDLFEDDLALGVDLVAAGTPAALDDVGEQVEPEGELDDRQARVVARCARGVVNAFISPPTASTAMAMLRR